MDWMLLPLKRYADFKGRSRRKEFWLWVAAVFVLSIVAITLDNMLGLGGRSSVGSGVARAPGAVGYSYGVRGSGGVITAILMLALLIPNLSVAVRRLHDIDRTGWWVALPVAPYLLGVILIGVGAATQSLALVGVAGLLSFGGLILGIVLLVFYCMPGTRGPNRFGPDPLDPAATADLSDVFR